MSYLLQDLVRVREHREEQAGQAVVRARRALREAKDAAARAEKELHDYAAWRVQEERRKLDSLMRRPLKLGEISDVRQEIGLLREREFEFADRLTQAQAAVAQAETQLEAARQKHAVATRELEKLLEHRRLWQRERALDDEHAADLELEDFSGPRPSLFSAPREDFAYARN
jgi:type III secretion protein O